MMDEDNRHLPESIIILGRNTLPPTIEELEEVIEVIEAIVDSDESIEVIDEVIEVMDEVIEAIEIIVDSNSESQTIEKGNKMEFLKKLNLPVGVSSLVAIAVGVFYIWKLLIPALVVTAVAAAVLGYLAVKEPETFEKVKLWAASVFNAGLGVASYVLM